MTTRTVQVPASIDATGKTDVSAALSAWIAGVPNGSILDFAGGTFRLASNVNPKGKQNCVFEGHGATLILTGQASNNGSGFYWSWLDKPFPQHLAFQNFTVKGPSPKPGTLTGDEFAAFLHLMGGSYIECSGISGTGLTGDLVTLNENPDHVWVHDNNMTDIGRNGVSIMCGSDVLIEDNEFGNVGYCVFDIEPESGSIAGISRATFRRNTASKWLNCFFAMDGVNAGKPISDIDVSGQHRPGLVAAHRGGWGKGPRQADHLHRQPGQRLGVDEVQPHRRPDGQ